MNPIKLLLEEILQNDNSQNKYIEPKPERKNALGNLIANEIGDGAEINHLSAIYENCGTKPLDIQIHANSTKFVRDAFDKIQVAIAELKKQKADKIDVLFHNNDPFKNIISLKMRFTKKKETLPNP